MRWIARCVLVIPILCLTAVFVSQHRQLLAMERSMNALVEKANVSKELRSHNKKLTVPMADYIASAIVQNSRYWNLDPSLITAVVLEESFADPHCMSNVGAVGLMQVMPDTAINVVSADAPLADVEVNIKAGTAWLAYLIKRYGEDEALRRYLFGESRHAKIHCRSADRYVQAIRRFQNGNKSRSI